MRMHRTLGVMAMATALWAVPAYARDIPVEASPGAPPQIAAIEKALHPQAGDIAIPEASAVLHLGDAYTFLPAADAKRVLTEAWGNPPETNEGVLGLVVPRGQGIVGAVWGAVVTYDASGYVTDDDARTADYNKLLDQLRDGEAESNTERAKAGYPAMNLVGWAQPPAYDPRTHSIIWARELKIGDQAVHGLNYDVRLLGRNGVLSLNMLSDMGHLNDVREAARAFGATADYQSGFRYADFDPNLDKKAGYGLAGLVAAGVGVAAVKKLGILALVLGLGKKLVLLVGVAFAAGARFLNRLRGRKSETAPEAEARPDQE